MPCASSFGRDRPAAARTAAAFSQNANSAKGLVSCRLSAPTGVLHSLLVGHGRRRQRHG
jgi:hypothetical protein